jgi:uncharacterized damage-inducible protein DinB
MSLLQALLPNLADYLIYAAIALVTLTGVFKCLAPLWSTTAALRRAIRRLQNDAGKDRDKPIWQESRFMGRRLKGCWLRFLQNAEQLDRRGLPCNVEDYINDDTVTHGPGNATLAELIPSLLTSLGILGTFIGLMQGLTGLDMSDATSLMNGIPVLLDGMRFAFGTSVAGITCSLAFNMLNRILQGSSYRAIDDFVESFTQLAMQRPLDNDVQMICQNQDRNNMLFTATDTLPSQLADSVELAVNRAMQPVTHSMDAFLVGATRAQVDGVGRIVNNFIEQMNASLDHQFLTLGQTLTEINQNQLASVQRLEDSLSAANTIVNDAMQLHQISQGVTQQFENYVQSLNEAGRRDARFEESSAQLLDKLHTASLQQSSTIASLRSCQDQLTASMKQFADSSNAAMSGLRKASDASTEAFSDASKSMQDAGKTLSSSYQSFVTDVVEGMSRSLGLFESNMSAVVTALSDQLKSASLSTASTAQISEMQKLMTSMAASLKSAEKSLASLAEEG